MCRCLVLIAALLSASESPDVDAPDVVAENFDAPAAPEVLYLKNGDRFSGRSITFGPAGLMFRLPHDEIVAIPLSEIDRLECIEPPVETGDLVDVPDDLDELRRQFESSMPFDDPAIDGWHKPVREMLYDFRNAATTRFDDWAQRLELGGSSLAGNANQQSLNSMAKFEKKNDARFAQINFQANYAQSKGVETAARVYVDSTFDFYQEGPWFRFVKAMHEYNEFEHLDYRGTFSAGVGYRIIQDDKHRLVLRGGPGFTEEIYHSPILMRSTPDMFGEVEMNWPVLRRMQLEQKTTFSPSAQNFAMLRLINQTGLLLPLDERKRWNLRIGFRYEFNGRPNVNRLPSDYTTQFNIVYARP